MIAAAVIANVGDHWASEIYSVRYDAINAMLLNEFLKEHRRVEELETRTKQQQEYFQSAFAQQGKEISELRKALKEQAAQVQRVSAQAVARTADHSGIVAASH